MKKIILSLICMITLLSGCSLLDNTYSLKVGTDDISIGMSVEDLIEKGYVIETDLEVALEYNTYYEDLFSVTKDNQEVMKIQIGNFSLEDGKMKDGSIKRIDLSGNVILNDIDYTNLSIEEALEKLGDDAQRSERFNNVYLNNKKISIELNYSEDNKLKSISIDKVKK